jgi:hypothetical protein
VLAVLAWWLPERCNARIRTDVPLLRKGRDGRIYPPLAEPDSKNHKRLRRRPVDVWEEERPALKPLPAVPFDDRELAYRFVDPYGMVHFDGNAYSASGPIGYGAHEN